MNSSYADRHLRSINDRSERYKEWKVQRIQATFDLDRTTAAQTLEWIELKFANQFFAIFCGILSGTYVHRRLTPLLQARSLFFRKPWMVPFFPLIGFYCGYLGARQLRGRRFQGKIVNFEKMSGSNDVISRFRNTDQHPDINTPAEKISQYLLNSASTNRSDVAKGIYDCLPQVDDHYKNMRVKRMEKDADDLYWYFGKIHGLENIAYLTDEQIASTNGNPAALQLLINEVKNTKPPAGSFDGLISSAMSNMAQYKESINKMSLNRSDRTKLLSLPFFSKRRSQGPAPKRGMWQYDLFTEIAGGKEWDHYSDMLYDPEEKMTIYNYEKHLPPSLLEKLDTQSEEFKKEIKLSTILSQTEYEKHMELKESFRKIMMILSRMNEDEGRAFIHKIQSKARNDYLEDLHGGNLEAKLAKISEKESYLARNDEKLRREKLYYRKMENFPVEKAKIKDLFKNSRDFKERFHEEVGIYDTLPRMFDYDKRVVQDFIETAMGPMLALRNEIGLDMANRFDTSFLRTKDFKEVKESFGEDAVLDHSFLYFINSSFLPLNMTDYEEEYVGPGENRDMLRLPATEENVNTHKLGFAFDHYNNEDRNQYAKAEEWSDYEPKFNFFRTNAQEENAGDDEDDDDDDEDEGDEEEVESYVGAYDPNLEYDEEEYEPVDWEYENHKPEKLHHDSAFFGLTGKLDDKYDNLELESFMKFLDVKPFLGWRDTAGYHNRVGLHSVEDFSQRVDPEFHMLAEVERESFERKVFTQHRKGSTVRFVVGNSKPRFGKNIDD